jgi:hypothetical protein
MEVECSIMHEEVMYVSGRYANELVWSSVHGWEVNIKWMLGN